MNTTDFARKAAQRGRNFFDSRTFRRWTFGGLTSPSYVQLVKTSGKCDVFTGLWVLDPEKSRLNAAPRSWIQRIEVLGDEISVREEMVRGDEAPMVVSVRAKFDGKEYAVSGSAIADSISYTRVNEHKILGKGMKNGGVSLDETVTVSREDGLLTLTYSIYSGGREVANGTVVFKKR